VVVVVCVVGVGWVIIILFDFVCYVIGFELFYEIGLSFFGGGFVIVLVVFGGVMVV